MALTPVNVRLPLDLYRRIRVFGLERGVPVQSLIADAISKFLRERAS